MVWIRLRKIADYMNSCHTNLAHPLQMISVLLLILLTGQAVTAQIPTQILRGTILDAQSQQPIIGAAIYLVGTDPLVGTTTDSDGVYRIENQPVGYYKLMVSSVGYQTMVIPEILLESGNENIQELQLVKEEYELAPLLLVAPAYTPAAAAFVSQQVMTIEEARRFPATFDDPARLATSYPGVASVNDQANHIAIRGNSPASMTWYLEGVEIVNPSHTSNAGTPNDRLSVNGGGVNILSAQLLGTSTLLSSAFPASYGNTLSGVMDMRLRKGNSESYEYTAQLGLIGIDLAAEGPLSKNSDASFLINYRYSTLGILAATGVDFGGEEIGFQDISFNLSLPTEKIGQFTLFGVGGQSSNIFTAPRVLDLRDIDKDFTDIAFRSRMGLVGMTHRLPLATGNWNTTIAYSAHSTSRVADFLSPEFIPEPLESDSLSEGKLSIHSAWKSRLNSKTQLQLGTAATLLDFNVHSVGPFSANSIGQGGGWLLRPYAQAEFILHPQLELQAGLHYAHFGFNSASALEPRAALKYKTGQHELSLAYGLHSKVQPTALYFTEDIEEVSSHADLGFTRAHHLVLSHQLVFGNATRLKTELYYQRLFDTPQASRSVLNWEESFIPLGDQYRNVGEGFNYGLEVSWQHFISDGYYYLLNGSVFESKFQQSAEYINTRFNSNYLLNLVGGKEFTKLKKGKLKTWGFNLRVSYLGGFWETPIDVAASQSLGTTVLVASQSFSIQQPNIFKVDSRIYFRKNRENASSTFALDLQNMTNSQNLAFRYFDVSQNAVLNKYQLGLIPNLSWRIEF